MGRATKEGTESELTVTLRLENRLACSSPKHWPHSHRTRCLTLYIRVGMPGSANDCFDSSKQFFYDNCHVCFPRQVLPGVKFPSQIMGYITKNSKVILDHGDSLRLTLK